MTREERATRSLLVSTIMMLVAFIMVTSFNILYTNHVNRESDRNWCDLMVGLDERQQRLKTTDPDAIKFIRDVHDLRRKLRCPPSSSP